MFAGEFLGSKRKLKSLPKEVAAYLGLEVPLKQDWQLLEIKCSQADLSKARQLMHLLDQKYRDIKTARANGKYTRSLKKLKRKLARANQRLAQGKANSKVPNKNVTPSSFYETGAWREVRYKVLSKSNGKCALCGRTAKQAGSALHVDHIVPRSVNYALELMESNLQVLCKDCNLGKSNKDCRDWQMPEIDNTYPKES